MEEREERRRLLWAEAERLSRYLADMGALRVLVFGSLAWGEIQPGSDLDMVAILPSNESFLQRSLPILRAVAPRVPVDLIIYTPEEWQELLDERAFVQDIDRRGKEMYRAPAPPA